MNWIEKYIQTIIYGSLPSIDENTGEIIMVRKNEQGNWERIKKDKLCGN